MSTTAKHPYTSYNPFFLYPFLVWVIAGGLAQLFFDRQQLFAQFNTHHTRFLDVLMFYGTQLGEGIWGSLVMLMLLGMKSFRNWWYFGAALLCNLLPALLTQWVKSLVNAPRPLNYFHDAPWIHSLPEWPRLLERSFPSGHTCAAFSLFCFLALILTPKFRWIGMVFFLLGLFVGYTRMYLAAHFFADVYVGSIIGVIFTILVVSLMRKYPHYFFRRDRSPLKADA
jgi:membrane-associated phospholipid phosphatase